MNGAEIPRLVPTDLEVGDEVYDEDGSGPYTVVAIEFYDLYAAWCMNVTAVNEFGVEFRLDEKRVQS